MMNGRKERITDISTWIGYGRRRQGTDVQASDTEFLPLVKSSHHYDSCSWMTNGCEEIQKVIEDYLY